MNNNTHVIGLTIAVIQRTVIKTMRVSFNQRSVHILHVMSFNLKILSNFHEEIWAASNPNSDSLICSQSEQLELDFYLASNAHRNRILFGKLPSLDLSMP
jgi:hypothetical protein